jgi:branched-chain amino acid transport system permease protein
VLFIQLLNGLAYGALLFLLAVGLVLIFGLRRVPNFAHGGLFMLGAYVGYGVAITHGFGWGLLAAAALLAVLGLLLDTAVFRPLASHDPGITLLVTFGLLLVLEDFAQTLWGSEHRYLPLPPLLSGTVALPGGSFPLYRLLVIAAALGVAALLSLWLRFTTLGLHVRAASTDPMGAAVLGVDTDRTAALVVCVGAALAGLSGVLAAPLLTLTPSMGSDILVNSFIVVVIGGQGSFIGAFIAALAIGQMVNFGVVHLPWAATMLPFLLMVLVLMWRPGGLYGAMPRS